MATQLIPWADSDEWKPEPPERRRRGGRKSSEWDKIAADLSTRPGEWRVIAIAAPSPLASKIKSGKLAAFGPAGTYDAVVRDIDPETGRGDVWATKVPE